MSSSVSNCPPLSITLSDDNSPINSGRVVGYAETNSGDILSVLLISVRLSGSVSKKSLQEENASNETDSKVMNDLFFM